MDFKLLTASKISFRKPNVAISHLLKFGFSLEKRKNTRKVSVRFLTDNNSLRKNFESFVKAVYKKYD